MAARALVEEHRNVARSVGKRPAVAAQDVKSGGLLKLPWIYVISQVIQYAKASFRDNLFIFGLVCLFLVFTIYCVIYLFIEHLFYGFLDLRIQDETPTPIKESNSQGIDVISFPPWEFDFCSSNFPNLIEWTGCSGVEFPECLFKINHLAVEAQVQQFFLSFRGCRFFFFYGAALLNL